jgi:phosphate uptake regulator
MNVGEMDYRKLIEFGNGSYIVTIPKSWAKSNNLKKGDLLSMDEKDHEIVFGAKPHSSESIKQEMVIETSGKPIETVKAEIVGAYLNCFDTIIIHAKDLDKNTSHIKSMMRNLSGMEIMEADASKIVAKNILNPTEISMDNVVRRMDIIVRSMIDDALLCATGHYSPTVLEERDSDVNRLYFLGSRAVKMAMTNPSLSKMMGKTPWQLHSDKLLLMRLEKIADCQKRVARLFLEMQFDRETLADFEKLTLQFKEDFENMMKAYYQKDGKDALAMQIAVKERTDACNAFLMRTNARLTLNKQSAKQKAEAYTAAARLTENLKGTFSQLKYMARYVMCYQ